MTPSTVLPDHDLDVDDASLLARVRAGDLDAYATLYERHRPSAFRLALRLAGPAGADDLVGEAFLRTLRILRTGRGPEDGFRGYLLASVRNTYYTLYKRNQRIVLVDDVASVAPDPATDESACGADEGPLLAAALATLQPRWRAVLTMTLIEDLPIDEVARRLGTGRGATAQLAYRAREALRVAYLEQHAAEPASERCRAVIPLIARDARTPTPLRAARIERHVQGCGPCWSAQAEIREVAGSIRPVTW